jgi:hypothetical protein
MRARRLVFLVCATALLALPASAVAKPGYVVDKGLRISVVSLPASGGYSVSVVGVNSRLVGITVSDFTFSKEATSTVSATYSVRGRVTDERIEGRFGSRGSVSVRFEPEGPPDTERFPSNCKGNPSTWQEGRFTGTIRFEGENGFARGRATTAKGFVIRSPRAVCKRRSGNRNRTASATPPGISLSAVSSRYPRAPWFSAFEEESSRPRAPFPYEDAEYNASTTEKRGGMTIYRSANATASRDTFEVAPLGGSPITATVEPPAPFSGTAIYEKKPGGEVSWSGDLAVELPGRGKAPLADSSYSAKLCRNLACACPIGECASISIGAGGGRRQLPTAAAPTPSPLRWPGSPR